MPRMIKVPAAARAASIKVRQGLAADWDDHLDQAPATLRRRWITLAEGRIPGGLHTFAVDGDLAGSVTVVGGIVDAPTGHVRFDPFRVLSGGSVAEGVIAEGPHPWRDRTADEVFPTCLLMFPNYETAPVGPGARDPRALQLFVEGLIAWCRENGVRSISALFLRPDYPEFLAALRAAGFAVVPMVDRCDMAVTWKDFDGYVAGLPRKRRFAVRRELRDIAAQDVVISERTLRAEEPELVRLRHQIVTKYGGTPDPEREAGSLRHLRDHFGEENVLVIEARGDGALLTFSIFIRDGDHWTVLMSGTDYERPESRFTYFATMFYRPAALAPQRGITTIAYGLGTIRAKKLRGCTVNSLSAAALLLD
jgi:hypothetical protein